MYWLKALLFFLLSPGVLLTLPPGSRGVFMSRQTSLAAAAVHALVFVLVLHFIYRGYASYYEGFQAAAGDACAQHKDCQSGFCGPDKKCAEKKM